MSIVNSMQHFVHDLSDSLRREIAQIGSEKYQEKETTSNGPETGSEIRQSHTYQPELSTYLAVLYAMGEDVARTPGPLFSIHLTDLTSKIPWKLIHG